MARQKAPLHPPLDNDKHEQFARCIAMGNQPVVCYLGVGYPPDEKAATALAGQKAIRLRAEEWYRKKYPRGYQLRGYKHVV